jgi:hypothetical protein
LLLASCSIVAAISSEAFSRELRVSTPGFPDAQVNQTTTGAPIPLNLRQFQYWPLYVYDLFNATRERYVLRAVISISVGCTEFLIGLAIAAVGGFTALYLTSPAVYILALTLMFFMGRAKWLGLEIIDRAEAIREAFVVQLVSNKRRASRNACHCSVSWGWTYSG